MKKILVDKIGYEQFFEELENLKKKSALNASEGGEAIKNAVGDGWHDNFAYEEAMREHRMISSKIEKMLKEQLLLEIVNPKDLGESYVNVGDVLDICIKYDEDDIEEETVILTGKYIPNTELDIKEISLNSPLGKAIFQKKVCSNVSYTVGNKVIEVKILGKR